MFPVVGEDSRSIFSIGEEKGEPKFNFSTRLITVKKHFATGALQAPLGYSLAQCCCMMRD